MRTFILFWNPAISTWSLDDCKKMIDQEEIYDCKWAVWDHRHAHQGDRFFMVRCGEGNTGIFESGRFASEPYKDEDWSGKGREVYYVDLDLDVAIDTESCPILTTDILQKEMPGFDWSGGHSGRKLPAEYEVKLETLWIEYLYKNENLFHRHAIRRILIDADQEFRLEKGEDDKPTVSLWFSLQNDGSIEAELTDPLGETIGMVMARTLTEVAEKAKEALHKEGINLPLGKYKYDSELFLNDYDMAQFVKAVDLASSKHRNQKDKAGKPYFGHVARVSNTCKSAPAKIVAILHDVVEDTDVTPEELEALGFREFVIKAVLCLTHQDGEPYEDYVRRAAKNPIAREVKIADLEDNMDVSRLDELTESDYKRIDKYHHAWKFLKSYAQ